MERASPTCAARFRAPDQDCPVRLPDGFWPAAQQLFGIAFAVTLMWGILAFPAYKRIWLGYVPVAAGVALFVWLRREPVLRCIESMLTHWSAPRFVLAVVSIAIALRIAAVLWLADDPVSDHVYYDGFAKRMLRGQGYGPTAYYPPGASFWLLMVYSVFGYSITTALLLNGPVGGLLTWLTYRVARHVVAEPAARLAAVLCAVFPSLVLYATTVGYDVQLGCALLAAVLLFVRRPAPMHPWWYVAIIGAALGVCTLLKPIGLLLPFVFGLAYRRRGASRGRAITNTALLTVALFTVLSPWTLRNYRTFGEFVPVTTSGGVGLWVTNHPGAGPMTAPLPEFPATVSEAERSRILGERARQFLRRNPLHLLLLAPAKAAYQWGTDSTVMAVISADRWDPYAEALAKGLLNVAWTTLGCFVVVALLRHGACQNDVAFWPLVALLAYLWGIHQVFEAQSRYHLPFLPVLFILAAAALPSRASKAQGDEPPIVPTE